MVVGGVLAAQYVTSEEDPLDMRFNGTFYVSASNRQASLPRYKGRMCCLSVFDSTEPTALNEVDVDDDCSFVSWPHTPPSTLGTGCLPEMTSLVPLTNLSLGYDVITGTPPIAPANFQCSRMKPTTPLPTKNTSHMYLDGSVFSFLTLTLADNMTNGDLTVAMMVQPDPPSEGVLLEYMADAGKQDGLTRMLLTLKPNQVTHEWYNASGLCASVSTTVGVPADQWSLVVISYQLDTQTVSLSAGGQDLTVSASSCGAGSPADTNGTLTLGKGSNPDHFGYHGAVACLLVTRALASPEVIEDILLDACVNQDYDPGLECAPSSLPSARKFKSVSRDHAPTAMTTGQVTNQTARSLVECSKRCLSTADCRAFNYKQSSHGEQCRMFNYVTKYGLGPDSGNHYYMVKPVD